MNAAPIATRIATFGASVALSLVVGLVTIPVLTATIGPREWAILALVQVISTLCGVFVSFGWSVTGPAEVAQLRPSQRPAYFARSLWVRGTLFIIVAPVTALVACLICGRWEAFIMLASVAYLLPTVGANWYFVGSARGKTLFLLDALPQQAGAVIGAVMTIGSRSPLTFAVVILLFSLASVAGSAFAVLRGTGANQRPSRAEVKALLKHQSHGTLTSFTASGYVSLPIVFVQLLAPSGLPQYTMADRFFRYGVAALAPIVQALQSWVPEDGGKHIRRRLRLAVLLAMCVGLIGAAVIVVLGRPVAALLSHGTVTISWILLCAIAVAFAAVSISQVVGLVGLVVFEMSRLLATSTLVGALVGVPLIVILGLFSGAEGVGIGLALSEVAVTTYQTWALRRIVAGRAVAA